MRTIVAPCGLDGKTLRGRVATPRGWLPLNVAWAAVAVTQDIPLAGRDGNVWRRSDRGWHQPPELI
jgi:hypothetical protein